MAWRRNLQVSSVGTSAERLGVGADHDGGRAAGAKGAATEETRKGLRLRILPGTGCHRAGPPSKSGARAGGGRSDDFTQSNCGGTEAELATSATTCLHPQPPSRAYICVRNQKKDDATVQPDSCLFHQDCITIGRDPDNDLPLCDDGRVVSKRHAEIVRTGAKVYLTDLASKNFTFLNGKRIEPEGRFEFDAADTIEIGPFEIRCNVVHAADATEEPNLDGQTAFAADFVNPFLDGAGRFAAVLNEIEQQYGSESPTRRRDALEKALQAAMEGQGDHETRAVVADVLGRLLKSDSGKPKWTACEPWWNQESISCALSGG